MEIKTTTIPSQSMNQIEVTMNVSDLVLASERYKGPLLDSIMRQCSQVISEEFLKVHLQEIMKHIDIQAITNMVALEVANKVREQVWKDPTILGCQISHKKGWPWD